MASAARRPWPRSRRSLAPAASPPPPRRRASARSRSASRRTPTRTGRRTGPASTTRTGRTTSRTTGRCRSRAASRPRFPSPTGTAPCWLRPSPVVAARVGDRPGGALGRQVPRSTSSRCRRGPLAAWASSTPRSPRSRRTSGSWRSRTARSRAASGSPASTAAGCALSSSWPTRLRSSRGRPTAGACASRRRARRSRGRALDLGDVRCRRATAAALAGRTGQWSGDGRSVPPGAGRGRMVPAHGRHLDLLRGRERARWLPWPRAEPVQVTSGPMNFWSPGSPDGRTSTRSATCPAASSSGSTPAPGSSSRIWAARRLTTPRPRRTGDWVAWVSHPHGRALEVASRRRRSRSGSLPPARRRCCPGGPPTAGASCFVAKVPSDLHSVVARISADGRAGRGPGDGRAEGGLLGPLLAARGRPRPLLELRARAAAGRAGRPGRVSARAGRRGPPLPQVRPRGPRPGPGSRRELGYRVRWAGRRDWEDIDLANLVYPNWTRDGKAIVGLSLDPQRVVRVSLATSRPRRSRSSGRRRWWSGSASPGWASPRTTRPSSPSTAARAALRLRLESR